MLGGPWGTTIARWRREGLPEDVDFADYFGLDRREFIPVSMGPVPAFEYEVLEEDDRYLIYRESATGTVRKALKEGTVGGTRPSMDQFLSWAVETPGDFETIKERYDASSPERQPADLSDKISEWKDRDCPLCLHGNGCFGFYSNARRWMGTENLSMAFYDHPTMVHAMMDFLVDFFIEANRPTLEMITPDYFNFFEDFAYKTGPLLSPAQFKEFLLPRYKRVIEFLRKYGVEHIWLDSDGNTEVLIPQLLEAGVTCHWPCEIAADMDPVKLRKQYGRDLALSGGIDKRELAKDRKAIEDELLGKLPILLESGGYIPTVDHVVPPDVPKDNFLYYLDLKRRIAEGRYGA